MHPPTEPTLAHSSLWACHWSSLGSFAGHLCTCGWDESFAQGPAERLPGASLTPRRVTPPSAKGKQAAQ